MELSEFLMARITEDEAALKAANQAASLLEARLFLPWRWSGQYPADALSTRLLATLYDDHPDYRQEWRTA